MQSLTLSRRSGAIEQRPSKFGRAMTFAVPLAVAALAASAAYAGADTTFTPALTKFTDFLEGSGGKIITVLSLAGGLIGLASGRFSLGQVAVPVGVGIGVGTGVPIVTSVVTAVTLKTFVGAQVIASDERRFRFNWTYRGLRLALSGFSQLPPKDPTKEAQ